MFLANLENKLIKTIWSQNRRQKFFNKGALRLCRGVAILKFDKNSSDLQYFIFHLMGLRDLLGGELSPPKPPWRRDCLKFHHL